MKEEELTIGQTCEKTRRGGPRRVLRSGQEPGSVAVMVGLERPLDRHADIVGLALVEPRELDAELVEVKRRDLLVEMLGQDVDLVLILAGPAPQLDLREHL